MSCHVMLYCIALHYIILYYIILYYIILYYIILYYIIYTTEENHESLEPNYPQVTITFRVLSVSSHFYSQSSPDCLLISRLPA